MLPVLLTLAVGQQNNLPSLPDRFIYASPLATLPPVVIDKFSATIGIAQQTARSKGLQGRMLWVDGTANMDKCNSEEKIIALVDMAADIGFNTIVYDIKPIVGYTLYPSKFTEKLTKWKGQTMPLEFDPVPVFVREAHKKGLSLMVSMNAFSEGHRIAKENENDPNSLFGKAGPGYGRPDEQTVQYIAAPHIQFAGMRVEVQSGINPKKVDDGKVGIFTLASSTRGTMVYVDGKGHVVPDLGKGIPEGGKLLVGVGSAGEWLQKYALPGRKLEMTSIPRFQRAADVQDQIPLMMNPTLSAVRQRAISFAREVVTNYQVDGLLFDDRMRFGGIDADFSEATRAKFEQAVGAKLNWPYDVFSFTYNWDLGRGVKPGPYWDRWWTWRARQLQTWVVAVRGAIKQVRPTALFGIYAGSWYGEYTKWGANYARPGQKTPFSSVSDSYSQTGFGDQLDLFVAGCYYKVPTIAEALSTAQSEGRTVEAGATLASRVIHDQAWTYAGIMLDTYIDDPKDLEAALQAACASSQGVMVFDLSHHFDTFEPILKRAFKFKVKAPHQENGLLAIVRNMLAQREKLGTKEAPIYVQPGSPGVGH